VAKDIISEILEELHSKGTFRTKDALAMGIHPRTLYGMREEGAIEQISRGIFRVASLPRLSHPDLAVVALRVPRAVICLISALAYHDATSEIPHEIHIALPRKTKSPKIHYPPLRIFWFSAAAIAEGIETVFLDGIKVHLFNLPKTVVDCFRFRNKLGLDIAIEGLNQAIKRKGVKPAELLRYARLCHIEKIMLPYIEALQ
jgi:predicted transcriptional regulator of viral defense system